MNEMTVTNILTSDGQLAEVGEGTKKREALAQLFRSSGLQDLVTMTKVMCCAISNELLTIRIRRYRK